jgi:hypothetical protein
MTHVHKGGFLNARKLEYQLRKNLISNQIRHDKKNVKKPEQASTVVIQNQGCQIA